MKTVLFVGLMLCAFAAATAQPVAPPSPPGPRPAPAVASPPAVPQATPAPATPPNFVGQPSALNHVLSLPRLVGRPFTFAVVFLFVGLVFSALARRVVLPRPPGDAHYADAADDRTRRHLAIANLVAWTVALYAASEAAGQQWLGSLLQIATRVIDGLFGLAGTAIGGVLWLAAAALVAYAISARGRDIVLTVVGWYVLRHGPAKPTADQEFDLGGGVRGASWPRTSCTRRCRPPTASRRPSPTPG